MHSERSGDHSGISREGGIVLYPGSRPLTPSDVSLLLQALSFLVLLYALAKKKESLRLHGRVAKMAFFLMLPSVFYMFYSAGRGLSLPFWGWLLTLHRFLGTLALVFGLLFVTDRWQWKRKKHMDAGLLCWLGALLLGAVVYMILFGLISP